MTRRRVWVLVACLALTEAGVALGGACSIPASPSGDSTLCNSPTGSCTDGSVIAGLPPGYTVPAQYGSTCTTGTYFIGPPSAWSGTCGSTIYVLCVHGTWSGAYCGEYLPDGWDELGPDGGPVLDGAVDADGSAEGSTDGGTTDAKEGDGSVDGSRGDAMERDASDDGSYVDAREHEAGEDGAKSDAKGRDASDDGRPESG